MVNFDSPNRETCVVRQTRTNTPLQALNALNDPAFIVHNMLRVGRRAIVSFPNWGHWRCRLKLLLTGRMPAAPGDPQPWDEAPRARGLTIADFTTFCAAQGVRIATAAYLQGARRVPDRFDTNLRATWAVFELR